MNTLPTSYTLIIGLGVSGLSMARFLHSKGVTVVGTDIDESTAEAAKELNALGIPTQVGFHDQETFDNADRMVPSPGIPLTIPYIKNAMAKDVPVFSELDIFYHYNQQRYDKRPVIAITGTNGKTTTTSLIGDMLSAAGHKPFVCGNIGTPLVDLFKPGQDYDIVVAEISSFQIDISQIFRPDIGVLLNITEDHLDRYKTMDAYEASKWRLFRNQTETDVAVINHKINNFDHASAELVSDVLSFSSDLDQGTVCHASIGRGKSIHIETDILCTTVNTQALENLPGAHNQENIAAALLAGISVGADFPGLIKGLETFTPLPHRIELIRSLNGIRYYNDSKATNTDAVIRAIQCFEENIILILGGREKDTDFSLLTDSIRKSVKTIIAIGETKTAIKEMFNNICTARTAETMADAVRTARSNAVSGDIVLLSPACASFDMYENYARRGVDFKNQVMALDEK